MKEEMNIKKGEERGEGRRVGPRKRENKHGPASICNKRGDRTFKMHIRTNSLVSALTKTN